MIIGTNSFNTLALIQPHSQEDVIAILGEVLSELANINSHLDYCIEACERNMQIA